MLAARTTSLRIAAGQARRLFRFGADVMTLQAVTGHLAGRLRRFRER
jgi:hypothetical protein